MENSRQTIERQVESINKALKVSKKYFLENFAKMICGDEPYGYFLYRSSSELTRFFNCLDLPYSHDRSTRWRWVNEVLHKIYQEQDGDQWLLKIYYALYDEKINSSHSKEDFKKYNPEKAKKAFKKLIEVSCKSSIPSFDNSLLNEVSKEEILDLGDEYGKKLLEEAKVKFNNNQKKDAINDLWDLFERIKTYLNKSNKKESTEQLIEKIKEYTGINEKFLKDRFCSLTNFGNKYNIRHHEFDKSILNVNSYEFVFYDMLNFLNLIMNVLSESKK